MLSRWVGDPYQINLWADLMISIGIGPVASYVFFVEISNTDRSDCRRLLALALMAGVFGTQF